MEPFVIVVGAVAEALAWAAVVRRHVSIWRTLLPVLALMGAAAVLTGSVRTSPRVTFAAAAAVGFGAGAVFYLATRAFVHAVRGWTAFQQQSVRTYERQGSHPLWLALVLTVGVSALGEEVFWRGLVQPAFSRAVDVLVLDQELHRLSGVEIASVVRSVGTAVSVVVLHRGELATADDLLVLDPTRPGFEAALANVLDRLQRPAGARTGPTAV